VGAGAAPVTLLRSLLAYLFLALDTLLRRRSPPPEATMFAARIVDRRRTPIVYADLPAVIAAAHEAHFVYALWPTAIPVVCGIIRLECGPLNAVGQLPNCWGNNIGNFDATAEELASADVNVFRTSPEHEGDAASTATQRHWRVASADVDAGARRWWAVMATGRFSGVVDLLHGYAGDERLPDDMTSAGLSKLVVDEMKRAGYFTGSVVTYEAAVEHFAAELERVA